MDLCNHLMSTRSFTSEVDIHTSFKVEMKEMVMAMIWICYGGQTHFR